MITCQTTTLNNGLKLITVPLKGTDTAAVLALFATGAKFESRQQSGLSHFLEHMFFKGTSNRPNAMAISSALDNVGAEFNAFTDKEMTGYWIKTAKDNLELSLDVVSDMLLNSLFSAEEIEREKGVIVEEINMYQDNPMWHIEDVFEELLYGDTPAGRSTAGDKETVMAFAREDFVEYFKNQYGAKSAVLVIAGNLPDNVTTLAEKYFAQLGSAAYRQKEPVLESQDRPALKLSYKATDQAHLSLGVRAFPYAHNNEFAMKLLSIILGGSMSSRLFSQLRERNGLCYYVRAQQETYSDVGYLTARAGVHTDKIKLAIELILKEYKKMRDDLVTDEELSRAKNMLKGKLPLSLESSDEVAEWYARQTILLFEQNNQTRKILNPDELLSAIDKVTAEDIRRVAQEIFRPERLNLAVIGPYKDETEFKDLLAL